MSEVGFKLGHLTSISQGARSWAFRQKKKNKIKIPERQLQFHFPVTVSMLIKSASTPTTEMAQRILFHNQISFPPPLASPLASASTTCILMCTKLCNAKIYICQFAILFKYSLQQHANCSLRLAPHDAQVIIMEPVKWPSWAWLKRLPGQFKLATLS